MGSRQLIGWCLCQYSQYILIKLKTIIVFRFLRSWCQKEFSSTGYQVQGRYNPIKFESRVLT